MTDLLSMTVHELRCALIELEMERDALKAALRKAIAELAIIGSYADAPDIAIGLRITARAHAKLAAKLRQLLGDKP